MRRSSCEMAASPGVYGVFDLGFRIGDLGPWCMKKSGVDVESASLFCLVAVARGWGRGLGWNTDWTDTTGTTDFRGVMGTRMTQILRIGVDWSGTPTLPIPPGPPTMGTRMTRILQVIAY